MNSYIIGDVFNINQGNVGIGSTTPTSKLDIIGTITSTNVISDLTGNVSGSISGGSVAGEGSGITALNATNISSGTLDNARLPSAISVTSLTGDGSGLTSLNATNISSGTLNNARLPSTITVTTVNADVTGDLTGNVSGSISGGSVAGEGSGLTALNATNISSGTLDNARLPSIINTTTLIGTQVGIGTNTPQENLHVEGNIYSTGNIVASNLSIIGDFTTLNTVTSNTEQIVVYNQGTGPALKVYQTGIQPIAEFYDGDYSEASQVVVKIANDGKLGIGTEPREKLDIIGTAIVSTKVGIGSTQPISELDITGSLIASGNVSGAYINGNGTGLTSLNAANISSGTLDNARLPSAISVTSLTGDGSGLTSLNATNISSGTLDNARLPSIITVTTVNADVTGDLTGNVSGSISGGSVAGEGSGLTALNATNISSGTLDNARLPSAISVTSLTGDGSGLTALNATNISSGTLNNARLPSTIIVTTVNADVTGDLTGNVSGSISGGSVAGEGSGLTALNATNISSGTLDNARLPSAISVTSLTGDGSGITALNATNISSGTLNNSRLPSTITVTTVNADVTGDLTGNVSGSISGGSVAGEGTGLTSLNATNISSGTLDNSRLPSAISVTSLTGDGSGLTALNATNISSGTLDNARLPSTITVTTVNADVTGDLTGNVSGSISGGSVAGEGSGLTALNATNISSGTLDNARLPSAISVTSLTGDGSGLTALNATNISSGTLDNARLPSAISVTSLTGDGSGLTSLNAGNISSGTIDNTRLPSNISVTSFTGDGSGLTNINADNISSGTLNNDRLPTTITSSNIITDSLSTTVFSTPTLNTNTIIASNITLIDYDANTDNYDYYYTTKNSLQVKSIHDTIHLTNSITSNFTYTYNGIYKAEPEYTNVHINGYKLVYSNVDNKDYDVSYTNNYNTLTTDIEVTLEYPPIEGSVVDITISPQYIDNGGVLFGYALQTLAFQKIGDDIYYLGGNVGIGTDDANYTMHIEHDIYATNIYTCNVIYTGYSTLSKLQVIPIEDTIVLDNSITSNFTFTYDGIFKAEPNFTDVYVNGFKLAYSNVSYNDYNISYTNNFTSNTSTFILNLNTAPPQDTVVDIKIWPQEIEDNYLNRPNNFAQYINTFFKNNEDSDIFYTDGNVGIGTNNPQAMLEVNGDINVSGDILPTSNVAYDLGSSNYRWKDLYLSGNTIDLGGTRISRDTTGNIDFKHDNGNTLMRIHNDGKIGIGTNSNDANLDITGSVITGITWNANTFTTRVTNDNSWNSITWSPELGLFVAVAGSGTGNRVMTSPDGINWTTRSTNDNIWLSITWAPELGLLVAVSISGTGDRVMTSPDGINWTTRVTNNNQWRNVVWAPEIGLLVAIAYSGTGDRVMTSPDGINWTTRVTNNNAWFNVVWAPELGLLVAISAFSGTGNRVMTSPDGINWTTRSSAADNDWVGITWAPELGLLVATSRTGTGNRIMTSPNGINWTTRSTNDNEWESIIWASELGLFVAVSDTGTGNRVMTSPDGINWTTRSTPVDNNWWDITWAPELGLLVAVEWSGTGDCVMTASANTATSSILKAKEMKNSIEISNITVPYDTNYNRKLTIRGDTTITGNGIFPGKVGIGTNNPLSKLSITPYDVEPKITLWDGGSTTKHYGFGVSSGQLNYHVDINSSHVFYNGGKNGDGTELMRIRGDDGSTYVNTLRVSSSRNWGRSFTYYYLSYGGIGGYPTNSSGYSVYSANRIAATEFDAYSDTRIKSNIIDVNDSSALEIIRKLKPKTYNYKDTVIHGEKRVYGFIAQEVKEELDYAVNIYPKEIPDVYTVGKVNIITNNSTDLLYNEQPIESMKIIIDKIVNFTPIKSTIESKKILGYQLMLIYEEEKKLIKYENIIVDNYDFINEQTIITINVIEDNNKKLLKEMYDLRHNVQIDILVYGQKVDDFHHLNKDSIWTVSTAALQEIDRQLQTTKEELQATKEELQTLKSFLQNKYPGEL